MWGFKPGDKRLDNIDNLNIIYLEDMQALVKQHPEMYEVWDKIPNWVTRRDISRYLLMYFSSGTYLDIDCVKQKDIPKNVLDSSAIILYTEHVGAPTGPREDKGVKLRVGNYAMTSVQPLQEFWLKCIDESIRRIQSIIDTTWTDEDVRWCAGSGMLSEVYHNLEDKSGIIVLDDTYVKQE
tara:strand:- start:222 stop:764 length:543 start_codon:yes stop_codon:yes gene_type:complete